MKLKKSSAYLSYRIWALEIVSGIILLCLAFWISIHADISNAAQRLSSTVNYVKEQCNNNQKMELASETKSLMRIMESAEYINRNLASDMEKSGFEEPDQALLENYAKESYVNGVEHIDNIQHVRFKFTDVGLESVYNEAPKITIDQTIDLSTVKGDDIPYMRGVKLKDDHDKLTQANVEVT